MLRRRIVVALLVAAALAFSWNRFQSVVDDIGVESCEALPVVVHLVGEHHELIMYDGVGGPLYTVKDETGGVVAGCVAEHALFVRYPELEAPTLGVIHTLHTSQMGYVD